jgi:hypothetical protein
VHGHTPLAQGVPDVQANRINIDTALVFGGRLTAAVFGDLRAEAVILDVEATTTIRQAEVGAAKTMLDRTAKQFDLIPSRLVADGGYGSADMVGWLVNERVIESHVNLIDKSERTDGAFSRSDDFTFDTERDLYVCPGGKELRKSRRAFSTPRESVTKDGAIRYRAAQHDCDACMLKPMCCPNTPARKIARSVHEAARDKARAIAKTEAYAVSCRERKKVEMLFAHLKRILRLGRLRLRGPKGAKDEFLLAAATAPDSGVTRPSPVHAHRHMAFLNFAASSDPPVASPAL